MKFFPNARKVLKARYLLNKGQTEPFKAKFSCDTMATNTIRIYGKALQTR